jgi:TonB family protein
MRFFGRVSLLSVWAVSSLFAAAQEVDQTATTIGAVLVKLKQPVYPHLARLANIDGEVIVTVTVHADGKAGVALESGHPILAQAALDRAKRSQFECRRCESTVPYRLVYWFRLTRDGDCCSASETPQVAEEPPSGEQDRAQSTYIAITAQAICLCDPGVELLTRKTRSVKCLYLWRCS